MWLRARQLWGKIRHANERDLPSALDEADAASALYSCQVVIARDAESLSELTSLRGMVCAHVLHGEAPILCIYWRSRDDFEREEPSLRGILRRNSWSDISWQCGFVRGYVSSRRNLPWYTIITTILALIGAFESIRLLVRHVFQRPDVLLTAGRAGAINYFPEQQLFESFRLTSRISIDQRVVIRNVNLQRGNANVKAATYEPQVVSALPEGQSETIQASVALPAEVGSYNLATLVETKAGWLRTSRMVSYSMPVKVWSPVPSATFELWSRASETVATAQYRLEVGYAAPSGLDCTAAVIGSPPDIHAIIPQMVGAHGSTSLSTSGAAAAKVVSQRWTTRPFADFAATTVRIVFQATQPVAWNKLPREMFLLNCSPHDPDLKSDAANQQ